jgi:two-component system alkaline phosphatase synthesis response regulator PhoP
MHLSIPLEKVKLAEKHTPRILIVDDEQNIRHLLRLAFEGEFNVIEANDGIEAFDKAVREKPDIILSDIMMPRLDGYGLYRKIRSRPETASVPFVFLSAKKDVDDRVVGLEMGAEDYITKPFSVKELKAKIRSLSKKIRDLDERGSLEGLLREVDLVDVIQLIEMSRKTGMLLVESPGGSGRIYFEQGTPIFARTESWSGTEALYCLLTLKEGRFRLDQRQVSVEANIQKGGGQELLMEGVRLSDEMKEARRKLPPPETVVMPGKKALETGSEMSLLVDAFIGGATISEAESAAKLPPYRFYTLLEEAIKGGFLTTQAAAAGKSDLLRSIKAALEEL